MVGEPAAGPSTSADGSASRSLSFSLRVAGLSVGAPARLTQDRDPPRRRRRLRPRTICAVTRTAAGTPIRIDRRFVEADLRIATGLVEPHFMAGWSGGRKVIAPGVAGHETIRTFHSARFMGDPLAVQCNLIGNPLHEEQLEIVRRLGPCYALNTIIGKVASCTISLSGAPSGFSNVAISADTSSGTIQIQPDPTNGWSYGPNMTSVILNGTSCDNLKNGTYTNFQFYYACPGTTIHIGAVVPR